MTRETAAETARARAACSDVITAAEPTPLLTTPREKRTLPSGRYSRSSRVTAWLERKRMAR